MGRKNKYKNILKGIFKGCKISSCYLSGGETAEMPGIYDNDKFDLAGFSVGIVDKNKILDGKKIKNDNLVLAIPSSGLHSNGFSLVRYILKINRINNKKLLCILIGPEGDYTEVEREKILKYGGTQSIKLGNNILRTETAVISALSVINFLKN